MDNIDNLLDIAFKTGILVTIFFHFLDESVDDEAMPLVDNGPFEILPANVQIIKRASEYNCLPSTWETEELRKIYKVLHTTYTEAL